MRHNAGQLQIVHKPDGNIPSAFQAKGDHAAGPVGHILLGPLIIGAALQAGIIHPRHLIIGLQILCHLLGVLTVSGHSEMQSFQTHVEQERVLRGLDRAEISHQLRRRLGDICFFPKSLRVNQSVIGLIRSGQPREFILMGHPVKISAVHNTAAHSHGMSVHVFCGGMGHNIRAEFKGPAVDGRSEGIVHDQRNAMIMGRLREFFNIQNNQGGVGDGFSEHRLCVGTEFLFQILRGNLRIHQSKVDAQLPEGYGKQVGSTAVDRS